MGKFITFEGGEGSGKTSHLISLAKYLRDRDYTVRTTHDPGDTPIGNSLRPLLLDKKYGISKEAEFLLYLAARAELVDKIINQNLRHVDFVLCDRFFDSTTVYQGLLRGWNKHNIGDDETGSDEDMTSFMHRYFSQNLIPDHTFLFDVNPVLGLNRSKGFDKNESRWEEEGLTTHTKINNAFYSLAIDDPRFIIIDANIEMADVFNELVKQFKIKVLGGGI
jgi:dTMP kinase